MTQTISYVDDRSRTEHVDEEQYVFENLGGAEIMIDFNEVFEFLEKTTSQVTWKWRGALDDVSQRIRERPHVPSKFAVLKMTLPHTMTVGTMQGLCHLCQRVSGDECAISLGVRFHREPTLEVAYTQFL